MIEPRFSQHRAHESGFTLAETLAALFVLSMALTALASFVSHTIKVQDRTKLRIESARTLAMAYLNQQSIALADGSLLSIAHVEPDTSASCLYDVLQRRCR